jgi:hypothetical protein
MGGVYTVVVEEKLRIETLKITGRLWSSNAKFSLLFMLCCRPLVALLFGNMEEVR